MDFTQETKKNVGMREIKVLLKWKLYKIPPGNQSKLETLYIDTPDPEEVVIWSKAQEK